MYSCICSLKHITHDTQHCLQRIFIHLHTTLPCSYPFALLLSSASFPRPSARLPVHGLTQFAQNPLIQQRRRRRRNNLPDCRRSCTAGSGGTVTDAYTDTGAFIQADRRTARGVWGSYWYFYYFLGLGVGTMYRR
ncbi:uncharacterized protein BJX67DRAFT_188837 [Aspergillus lucknowensis]|uniref:Uncharacterized protein n=1 Tax=Aspergillus lucknowensis TaxID=176173 RepID=A0ABR4LL89_9EURO